MNDRIETLAIKKRSARPRAQDHHQLHQVHDRPHARRGGRSGGCRLRAGPAGRHCAPTINLTQPDPDCDLDYTPLTAKHADFDVALSSSLGFGGLFASPGNGRIEMRDGIVITGMGVVTPVGIGVDTYWGNLTAGVCGIGEITQIDTTALPIHRAAEVTRLPPEGFYADAAGA